MNVDYPPVSLHSLRASRTLAAAFNIRSDQSMLGDKKMRGKGGSVESVLVLSGRPSAASWTVVASKR